MPQYICAQCNLIFEGHEPFHFGTVRPDPAYPDCPNDKFTLPATFPRVSAHHVQPYEPAPKPAAKPGAWGAGGPKIKPETKEELEARLKLEKEEAEKKAKADAEQRIAQEASSLMKKIELAISQRNGGASSNYAMDEQYSVNGSFSAAAINKAISFWQGSPGSMNNHCLTSFKTTGNRNCVQTNFIRNSPNQTAQGSTVRYNVHVSHEKCTCRVCTGQVQSCAGSIL